MISSYEGFKVLPLAYPVLVWIIPSNTLNTLYCAPNKIFEYALCEIPSISNELPAMREIYRQFNIGKTVNFTPVHLADAILEIDKNYKLYNGFKDFLDRTDTQDIINSIRTK